MLYTSHILHQLHGVYLYRTWKMQLVGSLHQLKQIWYSVNT